MSFSTVFQFNQDNKQVILKAYAMEPYLRGKRYAPSDGIES